MKVRARVCVLATTFICCATFCLTALPTAAAPIKGGTATYDYFNTFVTRLFPGTPFNDTGAPTDVRVDSNGTLTTVWEDQIGDAIDFDITSIVQTGVFGGLPYEILGGTQQTPELGPFDGSYQNIVQDVSNPGFASGAPSSLTSAHRRAAGPFAQVFFRGTVDEIYLYAATPYLFENTITALPYSVGTELIGFGNAGNPVDIYLRLGVTPDPSTDLLIGQALPGGIVRIDRIVPEPSTILLTVFAMIRCTVASLRRRKA